jgi:hypothetical protein
LVRAARRVFGEQVSFVNLLSVTGGHRTNLRTSPETWLGRAKCIPHLQFDAKANPASGRLNEGALYELHFSGEVT